MKKIIILILTSLLYYNCNTEKKSNEPFYLGKWHVKNKDVSQGIYEIWTDSLQGIRYNQQGSMKLYEYKMHFETSNDSTFFVINSEENEPKKYYVSQKTDTSFIAENPDFIFTSKIIYSIRNEELHIKIVDKSQEHNYTYILNKVTKE